MLPFQCDLCHFRNINKRDPLESKAEDVRLLRCIRRANLDAMWSREPSTVAGNLRLAIRAVEIAKSLGIDDPFPSMGPFPIEDTLGMKEATILLMRSLDVGKYKETVQFETMRKMRGVFANAHHASAEGYASSAVMAKDTRKLMVTECVTYGTFFENFIRGCHKRMGDIAKPDRAISLEVLHHMISQVDTDYNLAAPANKLKYALEGSFYLIAFCAALRGEEVTMVNLTGVIKHWHDGVSDPSRPHVVIALLGRLKNEVGERYHLVPLAAETKSGLKIRMWIARVIEHYTLLGINRGPMFRAANGFPAKAGMFEESFIARLERTQEERPDLISKDSSVSEDYGIFRSFRRGATSEATNRGVEPEVIEANNRWRKVEKAKGKKVSLEMREHYADVRLILNELLKFSTAL